MTTNPTQSSSEELRDKVRQAIMDDPAITFRSSYSDGDLIDEEIAVETIMQIFASHLQAYTEEIRREVIGKNTKPSHGHNTDCDCYIIENDLRAEQRQALSKVSNEWGRVGYE